MTKDITITLRVKETEDDAHMIEQIRAALMDRSTSAHDLVDQFLVEFEPADTYIGWTDLLVISYATAVSSWDESGDATIMAFLTEHPEWIAKPTTDMMYEFLLWCRGERWWEEHSAYQFRSDFG